MNNLVLCIFLRLVVGSVSNHYNHKLLSVLYSQCDFPNTYLLLKYLLPCFNKIFSWQVRVAILPITINHLERFVKLDRNLKVC